MTYCYIAIAETLGLSSQSGFVIFRDMVQSVRCYMSLLPCRSSFPDPPPRPPQGGSSTYHIPWFRRFWFDRDREDLVACGAAAGVAAAFRSPVGGVLFALEEMTTWWRNQLLWYAFFTTAVVSVAGRGLVMGSCEHRACIVFNYGLDAALLLFASLANGPDLMHGWLGETCEYMTHVLA